MKSKFLLAAGIAALLFFGATGCTWHDAGQVASDLASHVNSVGGTVTVDPNTGAITVGGSVSLKQMDEAVAISNAIKAQNEIKARKSTGRGLTICQGGGYAPITKTICKDGKCHDVQEIIVDEPQPQVAYVTRGANTGAKIKVKAVSRPVVNACGQKGIVQTFEVQSASIWHRFTAFFIHAFKCSCPHANEPPPYVPTPEYPQADFPGYPTPPAPQATSVSDTTTTPPSDAGGGPVDPDTDAIISQVLANDHDNIPAERGNSDRAVVFGNNFPGTDAELHQCVNDAKKNVVNLVKVDHFDPKNIRLFTNRQCTKANYERWAKWALVDGVPTVPDATNSWGRRRFFNSSHGAEDTDSDGKVIQVLVTDDMVRMGHWDSTTEVSFDFWYSLLRQTDKDWLLFNDSCHSGGQTRYALGLLTSGRKTRSLDGPAPVQARLAQATARSTAVGDMGKLTGTVFAVCLPNELASEGPNGGVGTNGYWQARKNLPKTATRRDIVKEINRLFRQTAETQHFMLSGVYATPLD